MEKKKLYDVTIIGAGPSGLMAAVYCLREGLNVLILEKAQVGGNLMLINKINNFPSYEEIHGIDLAERLKKQVVDLGGEILFHDVCCLKKDGRHFAIIENGSDVVVKTKTVVIATGTREKRLGVSNEERLIGHGVSYCSLCDGPLFRNKVVAVVGGGDRAYTEAIHLSSFAKEVLLLQRNKPKAEVLNIKTAKNIENIKIVENVEVLEINGESRVESITTRDKISGRTQTIEVKAVFPLIGSTPNTDFIKDLDITNDQGYILVNPEMETKVHGVYACGDVIDKTIRQVATATGDGAVAGAMVSRYVKHLKQ